MEVCWTHHNVMRRRNHMLRWNSMNGEVGHPIFFTVPVPKDMKDPTDIIRKLYEHNGVLQKTHEVDVPKASICFNKKLGGLQTGWGKNKFNYRMKRLTDEESENIVQINTWVEDCLFPQGHFLWDNWHIWSDDSTTCCYMFRMRSGLKIL